MPLSHPDNSWRKMESCTNPPLILHCQLSIVWALREGMQDHRAPSLAQSYHLSDEHSVNSWTSVVLQRAHSSQLMRHPGIQRTKNVLLQHFCWPTMHEGIHRFNTACPLCWQHESFHLVLSVLLWPWPHISKDFVSGLPPSNDHTAILSSKDTASLVLLHIFRLRRFHFGIPQFTFFVGGFL